MSVIRNSAPRSKHELPRRRRSRLVALLGAVALSIPGLGLAGVVNASAAGGSLSVDDFSQCANGAPPSTDTGCPRGWINGALQKSNSHYAEDQVVPQRIVASVPKAGTHTFVISWQDRKGSANAHAYDSLATWNTTQSTADPCLGLKSCPAANGAVASKTDIPLDSTPVVPCAPAGCSTLTSAHQLTGQQLWLFGGTLQALGANPYSHSAPAASGTDDYTTLTITYTTTAATTVELLYGGHLAPTYGPRGWGSPYGSSNVNGGPYHFKFQTLDGASAGSRDNQIQASAILGPPAFTVTKTASPTTAAPGQTVTYTITVTNTGGSAGSTTFEEDNDSRVTNVTFTGSSPTGGTCSPISGTTNLSCQTSTINPGSSQVFTVTVKMPTTFSGTPASGCSTGQYPVIDTVTLANGQQAQAKVCVNAAPAFTVTKVADKSTANPGDTVTYTITVTNNGAASGSTTFTDVNDPHVTNVAFTGSSPTGGTCSPVAGTTNLSCQTSTLNPGASQVFTVTVKMPATFSGTPASGCGTGQYPVIDTVTLANGQSAQAKVCVNAAPDFTVTKSANPTTAAPGATVTYTITVINRGTAPGSTTFTDVNDPNVTSVTFTGSTPSGGTCSAVSGTTNLSCTTSTINAGSNQVFTVTVKMPTTFSGTPASGCGTGQYPVFDTVTLANGQSAQAKVCVNAAPSFVVSKSANTATASPGQTVTYTITVTNNGAAAGSTTFTDVNDPNVTNVTFTGSSPTGGTCSPVAGTTNLSCTTSTINPGSSQVFTVTVKMPLTFTGTPASGCGTGQYPVIDTVTLANGQSAQAKVCVNATPDLRVTKVADKTTANPGDTVTYTITVTNNGAAPGSTTFTDVNDPNVTNVTFTGSSPTGGTCSPVTGTTNLSCTTSTINPGGSQVFTVTVKLPLTFSGTPASGCGPGQYPVFDTVTLANGRSAQAKVCVNAAPRLTLVKSADKSAVLTGDSITYTLTYANTGSAPSSSTTITEAVPAGTQYLSCTGGCGTNGPPVTSVTWSIGSLAAGGGGSVTMTVKVITFTACSITNTAHISSPDFNSGVAGDSNPVTIAVIPTPNVGAAKASGSAVGASLTASGQTVLTLPTPSVSSSQTGPGSNSAHNELLSITGSQTGGLLAASVLRTATTSSVTPQPAEATDTSQAEAAGVCILPGSVLPSANNPNGCTVNADVLYAVASTEASGTGSYFTSAGSTVKNLYVNGVAQNNVKPNTVINLPTGTKVTLDEEAGSASRPPSTQTSGGLYSADLAVTMVHVTNLLGLDIAVAQAISHAEFPQLTNCGGALNQQVSGDALIASEDTTPSLVPVVVGYVSIPESGGTQEAHLTTVAVPNDGSAVTASAADTYSTGSLTPTPSAHSYADVTQGVCILPNAVAATTANPQGCLVKADLVRSEVHSSATGAAATSDDTGTQLVNVLIAGNPVPISTPPPNTAILLPGGLGSVVLNEHVCTAGAPYDPTTNPTCAGTTDTGMTVTAIHVLIVLGGQAGAEVKVVQAHSDAHMS